jgi:hypothetical protein
MLISLLMFISAKPLLIFPPQLVRAQISSDSRGQDGSGNSIQQYHSDKYGISILYPVGWTVQEGVKGLNDKGVKNIVTIIPPGGIDSSNSYHNYLSINIERKVGTSDIGTYLSEVLDSDRDKSGFHYVESDTNALLAGQPASRLTFNFSDGTMNMELRTIFNNDAYLVAISADADVYDSYLPIFCKMISTIQTSFGQGGSCDQGTT